MLLLLSLTPAGAWLAVWAEGVGLGAPFGFQHIVALCTFTLALAALWELAWLPAIWYLNTRVDRKHAGRTAIGELLAAQSQAWLLAALMGLAGGAIVEAAAYAAGSWWWLLAGGLMAAVLVAALHVAPGLLARFSGAESVERPALVEQLGVLARKVRVPILSIDALPETASVTATALVAGTGGGRRVFIAAELMRDWSDEEIAVVVAHELAHHAHHDLWRTLALDVGVLSAGLWVSDRVLRATGSLAPGSGPSVLAVLPAVALTTSVVWLASAPLRHAVSRSQERRADAFALSLTGGIAPFQAAIRRLAERHLAEERPSRFTRWFYHRHPSVAERLEAAEAFQRRG